MYFVTLVVCIFCITSTASQDTETATTAAVATVNHKWTSIRITLSLDPVWAFQKIPLDFWEADRQGWRATSENCTNNGKFNGYRFIPKGDDAVAALYDMNGVIAGFQMMPKRNKVMSPFNTYHFDSQPMFQNDSILGVNVTVLTAYFVEPSTICTKGRTEEELTENGVGTGLWFQNGPSSENLISIPASKEESRELGWRDNNCLATMGFHSFYESENWDETTCTVFVPAWVFYDLNQNISGFGFLVTGVDDSPRYQHVQGVLLEHMLGDYSSQCAKQVADSTGVTLLNIYFDDYPERIICEVKTDEGEQAQSGQVDPNQVEPHQVEDQQVDPYKIEIPQIVPQQVEPQQIVPQVEPQHVEPQVEPPVDPYKIEIPQVVPQQVQPQIQPQQVEPQVVPQVDPYKIEIPQVLPQQVEPQVVPQVEPQVDPYKIEIPQVVPQHVEPQQVEPQQIEPQVDSYRIAIPQIEPQQEEPQQVDPYKIEIPEVVPQQVEPHQVEPYQTEPQQVEPYQIEPYQGESIQGEPYQGEPEQY